MVLYFENFVISNPNIDFFKLYRKLEIVQEWFASILSTQCDTLY